jgi:uncharacterized protein (DUF3820 family)
MDQLKKFMRIQRGCSIVTFGKYKGKFIKEVPLDYIDWVVNNHIDPNTVNLFENELERRERSLEI